MSSLSSEAFGEGWIPLVYWVVLLSEPSESVYSTLQFAG